MALARAAAAAGVRTIVATPHVSSRYPNDGATIAQLTRELNARVHDERVPLDILPGAELAMTYMADVSPAELAHLQLGGSGWLLVEPPFSSGDSSLDTILLRIRRGRRILLAHPERCSAFHRDPRMLENLVRNGVLTSITAGSLVGRFGRDVRRFALELVQAELVHNVASDAHDNLRRAPGIRGELTQAGLEPLTDWLTEEVPAALLADEEIPPRPVTGIAIPRELQRSRWRIRR